MIEDSRTIILASVLSVVAVTLLYYYCCGRKRRRCSTEYFYQKTVFNARAVERLRTSVGDYQAPWWFHPGWLALEYRRDLKVSFVRELVSYIDGTNFAVDWLPAPPAVAPRSAERVIKICLYFPGLGGNSTKTAVQNFARVLASSGYICGVVNQRGNTTPLRTTRLWHPGLTEDAERMLTDIFDTFNGSGQKVRIFLAGTSSSTNVIKKVLLAARARPDFSSAKSDSSLRGSDVKLSGGLGTCICFDYCANRRKLESTLLGRATSQAIASHYQCFIRQNPDIHAYFKESVLERLLRCRSLSEFDGLSSTELYGYSSERAFMDDLSSTDMKNMSLPYLAIQPGDDPVYGNDVKGNIPSELYTESENVIFMVPSHGGHGAFSEGSLIGHLRWQRSNEGTGSWPPRVAAAFFDYILEQEDHAALRAGYINLAD